MPGSAGRPAPEIHTNKDGTVTIQYVPKHSGVHEVNLTYNEQPVSGTPLHVIVDEVDKGFVTAYGTGLSSGNSGKECEFFVVGNTKELDFKVDGPGKADIIKKAEQNGVVSVVYIPMSPGEYNVNIKYKGKHIHGSPFSSKISGEGRKRSQLSVPATSIYTLGGHDVDLTGMVGVVKAPGGTSEPCLLKKMPDGKLGVAGFQPKKKGSYAIEVTQDGRQIAGSPFKVEVGDAQLCHAGKVKVSGANREATANKWNDVHINIAEAGLGAIGVSVEGAHRSDIELKSTSVTEHVLQYKPHEPGIYLLNIKFGDDHVTGSPFMVNVGGDPSGRSRETMTKQIQEAEIVSPGQKCDLQLRIPGTQPLDMEATLTSPSGKSEACEIRDMPGHIYDIKFTPQEDGIHTVSIKYKGIHITGSPFQYTVGKSPAGGTHKVDFGGVGVDKGEVGIKNEFNIYTREAGPGLLSVGIEGPSKAAIDMVENPNGYTMVSYSVSKEGDYGIHVKYNDEHVPNSPAIVHVAPESKDAKLVTIHGLRDRGLDVEKPATFNVKLNGAIGTLKGLVKTPSGTEEDVFSQELDQDEYAMRFMPRENGVYYVYIKFNEAHIPGSPFPMLVGKLGADPALVFAKGDGLEKGEVGKASKFAVSTTNAGTGTLAVHIEGPSKVAVVCAELDDGYEFTYTPMAPGKYMIIIKYCNVTIAGCPFKAVVTGTAKGKPSDIMEVSSLYVETVEKKPGVSKSKRFHGDASKVVVQGNGLKKGFPGRPCAFSLDCKDAGQSLLTLGMISPTGNPVTELSYKKQRVGVYNVSYRADEKGDHTLTIRWGTDDVPGSPFVIHIG